MPRYDYRCTKGHLFELVHPMAEVGSKQKCPTCKRAAKIALVTPQGINGTRVFLNDKQRRSFYPIFKKSTVKQFETVKDVDRAMERAAKNYPFWKDYGKDILNA